jgi:uncharacterized membrane protein
MADPTQGGSCASTARTEPAVTATRDGPLLHPLHAILLAFPVALFTGAVLTDLAYLRSAHIQWSNFSSWLIAGGLLMAGLALLWQIVAIARARGSGAGRPLLVLLLLLGCAFVVNFFNALVHSRDAWASVGATGMALSCVAALLALAAGWVGFGAQARRDMA